MEELESELDDEYDKRYIGNYDEDRVKNFRIKIGIVEVELKQLEKSTEVKEMRKSQRKLKRKLRVNQQCQERYQNLIDIEQRQPPISLTREPRS